MPKKSKVQIQPLHDRVLVEPLTEVEKEKVTDIGIILPGQKEEEQPHQGTVLAVGGDQKQVKAGDKVIFSQYGYEEIKMGDSTYYLVKGEDVLAIIK